MATASFGTHVVGATSEELGRMLEGLGWRDVRLIDMSRLEVDAVNLHRIAGEWLFVVDR